MTKYKVGNIINGQVTGIEKYGIFVNIDAFFNGLIHISEISDGFVRDVNDYVTIGDTIKAKILEIDEDNGQIKLSIKSINYKNNRRHFNKIEESPSGFEPLKKSLSYWTEEKLKEFEKKK